MANPNNPATTDRGGEAVGSYRDPAADRSTTDGSSALGWIIGLLLLLGLVLLALWAFGVFGGTDTQPTGTTGQPVMTAPADPTAYPEDATAN